MKKAVVIIFAFFFMFFLNLEAKENEKVEFSKCVDGDTVKVLIDNEEKTVRLLAVDTPETKHPTKGEEPYGKSASDYTCSKLKKAKEIMLEYDPNSDKTDKYDRILAWIYADGSLLQEELIKKGYAKVAYLYGDYKYTKKLQDLEVAAKDEKQGMWSDEKEFTIWQKILNWIVDTVKRIVDGFVDKVIDAIF